MTDLAIADPRQLAARFREVRSLTEVIAEPLSAEDQTVQSMPDVSPTKWHRAHTTWFFETFILEPFLAGYECFHPAYRYLFNSYYEAVGSRHPRPERGQLSRPGIAEVARYRLRVDEAMTAVAEGQEPDPAVSWLIDLGLHHEQQHQELMLMDIKHVLSRNPLQPRYRPGPAPEAAANPPVGWIAHDGGPVEVGAGLAGFAFDNERPRHVALIPAVALADRPVTCGDWLEFVDDGGYQRAELWLSDGWAAVQAGRWEAPLYWDRRDGGWEVFTLTGPRPVHAAEPVCHVSYFEADAYARWAGARLPTEFEWEAVLGGVTPPGRLDAVTVAGASLHPAALAAGGGPDVGRVWEWTASAYLPYPGFAPTPGAVGEYNGKFMVNQHVLRGGCCATPAGHVRPTYRNFFPPAARWPFTGLRLARPA